ncbi:MAG: hypothetical protein ACOC6C_01645 [Verrucomicrobiota bacterium]
MRIPVLDDSLSRLYLKLAWLVMAVVLVLTGWLVTQYILAVPAVSATVQTDEAGSKTPHLQPPSIETDFDWAVFSNPYNIASYSKESGLASKFELVGTYFVYDRAMNNRMRKAIVDNIEIGTQHIVGEKEVLADDIIVQSIFREKIVLIQGGKETELWLSFSGTGRGKDNQDAGSLEQDNNKFGARKINDHRWELDRGALLDYYQELRNRPERLVQVFDSFDPIYDNSGGIEGYEIGIEGEDEFFEATGLRDGDIVREVNSIKMTSRRRAELFIHQFAKDQANTFVLGLERDGKERRLIYRLK